jgi:hypothetical protein
VVHSKGMPAPLQASQRWPVERTHAWSNSFGNPRWRTERRTLVVEFWVALAHTIIIVRRLIRRAWIGDDWPTRPLRRP